MDLPEDIHQKIIADLDKRDRLSRRVFGTDGSFTLTSDLNTSKPVSASSPFKIFKPSKPFITVVIFIITILWTGVFYAIATQENVDQRGLGIVMVALFFITVGALWQFFYDPSVCFTLRVDRFGIGIDDRFFQWDQIQETSIVRISQGRGYAEHLVIILTDGDFWTFDLVNFYSIKGIAKTISRWIEHYKSQGA